MSRHDDDNHANQCNPNNDAYWQSRGDDERPDDWENRSNSRWCGWGTSNQSSRDDDDDG